MEGLLLANQFGITLNYIVQLESQSIKFLYL